MLSRLKYFFINVAYAPHTYSRLKEMVHEFHEVDLRLQSIENQMTIRGEKQQQFASKIEYLERRISELEMVKNEDKTPDRMWVIVTRAFNKKGEKIVSQNEWLGLTVINNRIFDYDTGDNSYELIDCYLHDDNGIVYTITDGSFARLKETLKSH